MLEVCGADCGRVEDVLASRFGSAKAVIIDSFRMVRSEPSVMVQGQSGLSTHRLTLQRWCANASNN